MSEHVRSSIEHFAMIDALAHKKSDQEADHSFMSMIQQAGIGGKSEKNTIANVSHFDEVITHFVSKQVRRKCYKLCEAEYQKPEAVRKLPELTPSAVDAFAAVVMVDVSGYSKLTAALAERGPVGAELLSKTMKGYLDQIIEVIVSYGGDIVKFAGDAVVVYWSSDTAINMTDSSEDIERGELVYKAAHCCLTLLTQLGTYDINIADCATKTLRIHLGIGAGLVTDILVGGFPGRWEHFIAGEGVNQLSQVLDLAKAGELALSHQALKWLVWVVDIRTLNLGDYDKRCIILTGLAKAERRVPPPKEKIEKLTMTTQKQREDNMALYKNFLDRTALFKLQSDVNQSNIFQLDAGLLDLLNLSELRQVTTLFIKIESLKDVSRDELLQQCQDAITVVQSALQRYDGSLRQFQVDDKGAAILCFFGLPPLAHENDSELGISAGIEIREKFLSMFEKFSIGITTGVVSFGGVGTTGRAEYAVMGDAINMAARLMCLKEASCGILCDEKTFNLCERAFEFENLGETTVKGKSSPIAIFRPLFMLEEADNSDSVEKDLQPSDVIGRETEKNAIHATLQQLYNSPSVNINMFCGESGLGLTTLVNFARVEASKQQCHVTAGKATQMDQNSAFVVFRSIVIDIMHWLTIGSKNKQGHFKIPGNGGTISPEGLTSMIPQINFIKPGTKPKRKDDLPPIVSAEASLNESILNAGLGSTAILSKRKNTRKNSFAPQNLEPRKAGSPDELPIEDYFDMWEDEERTAKYFKRALAKVDIGENQATLLILLTKEHDDNSDAITQALLRLHAKDLGDTLTKILNVLTVHNKILIQITDAHWVDTLSWDLLLEIAVSCPRVSFMTFSRQESTFENKESRRTFKLIEQLPRTHLSILGGLTQSETTQLILATWTGHQVVSVDPKISESIFKRTDGNPFFIRSLVSSLKDSGQWRISPAGGLTTPDANFDFDKLVLGYDNQSIILAQFDKLDRNFQLFLKVASVLGQKFQLDDVLYFLIGVQNVNDLIEKKKYQAICTGLQSADKYGFLQKESILTDGAYFQFKSALVRKCIYSMMVHNQRQQIHLLVAKYLEEKMNEQNRHRYVVQILDHYMNTSAAYNSKRIHYTSMAASLFFEKDAYSETIRYCKQLLELIEDHTDEQMPEITTLHIANCHRELGYSLLMKEELGEAEAHLKHSLKLMGYELPKKGFKFKWALSTQLAKRKKLDKSFFKDRPVPQEEDYTQSYVAKKGASGYSLSNLVPEAAGTKKSLHTFKESQDSPNFKDVSGPIPKPIAVSPAQQMIRDTRQSVLKATQHALVTLAEVFMKQGNFLGHQYAILLGLNIATEESAESHMSRLFAFGALALRHSQIRGNTLPAQYMEAAISYDLRIDIYTSLNQVVSNATLLFLAGQLEASQNKLEVVSYLSIMAGDLSSRVYGLNLKCMLQTHSATKDVALTSARDLYNISHQRESWIGKFWGCFHIIHNLLGEENSDQEIQKLLAEIATLWEARDQKQEMALLPIAIAKESIQLLVPYFKKSSDVPEVKEALQKLYALIAKIPFHQWESFSGLVPLCLTLLGGLERKQVNDVATVQVIDTLCDTANKSLKQIKGLSLAHSLRRVFKGIRYAAKNNKKSALRQYTKGIDDQSEDIYVQAILESAIVKASDDSREDDADRADDLIKDLKAKARFAAIFKR